MSEVRHHLPESADIAGTERREGAAEGLRFKGRISPTAAVVRLMAEVRRMPIPCGLRSSVSQLIVAVIPY
ncbi:MAG: hypothetical protein JWO63_639 [Frankiales bacterium]|nr:hypothetical protein [Frankiales bacterium]